MRYSEIILIFLLLIVFVQCRPDRTDWLREVEEEMQHSPEKALVLLDSLPESGGMNRESRALYALLYVKALDKNVRPIGTDSLLWIALNYYRESGDAVRLAETYYYWGCYWEEMKVPQEAIRALVQADRLMRKSENHYLSGLICSRLGNLYVDQVDVEHGLQMLNRSADHFRKAGSSDNANLVEYGKARIFYLNNLPDSALYYLKQT